jgi:hypothetical protein
VAFCTGNCGTRMAWFRPAPALGLLLGLALAASQSAGQTPSKEYIHLGGRVIAIENAPANGGVPAAPTGLTATAGNHQVALSWTASTGATSYSVYRGTAAGGESGTAIGTVTTTSYTDTGLTNGTTYYYKVAAVNASGTSAKSNEASAMPLCSPATLTITSSPAPGTYSACTSITVNPGVTINPIVTLQIIQ